MNRRSIRNPRSGHYRYGTLGDSLLNDVPYERQKHQRSAPISESTIPAIDPTDPHENNSKNHDHRATQSTSSIQNSRQQLALSGQCGSERWRAHRLAEDYIDLVGNMMLPNIRLGTFGYDPSSGRYPIERITLLGLLQSPLRRKSVVETWNPLEIATFEAALAVYGKVFHQIKKFIQTKTTKEIVEFYYIWKKTNHYKVWKQTFLSSEDLDVDSDDD